MPVLEPMTGSASDWATTYFIDHSHIESVDSIVAYRGMQFNDWQAAVHVCM
jgi:hypothetical protein